MFLMSQYNTLASRVNTPLFIQKKRGKIPIYTFQKMYGKSIYVLSRRCIKKSIFPPEDIYIRYKNPRKYIRKPYILSRRYVYESIYFPEDI